MSNRSSRSKRPITASRRQVLKSGAQASPAIATLGLSVGVDFSSALAADPTARTTRKAKGVKATQIKKSKRTTVRQRKSERTGVQQNKAVRSGSQQIKIGGSRAVQDKARRTGTTADKIRTGTTSDKFRTGTTSGKISPTR